MSLFAKILTNDSSKSDQQQQNKALHPTAYSPLVPRSLAGAGEFSVVSQRPRPCVRQAVLWPLICRVVSRYLAASVLAAGAACSLWRGVWVSGGETNQQQHNQALHPTARSLRVFRLSGSVQSWSWLAGGG